MSVLRRHLDLVLAFALALVLSVEVLAHPEADLVRAVPCAALAGLALALRRRLALVMFLLVWSGLSGVMVFAPGLDGESLSFVVIFFIAHYSLGRWTSGREAWAGAVALLGSMVAFAVGDASTNDQSWSDISLGGISFTVGFVGGPWAAGWAIRLRQDREAQLHAENRQLQADQEERARRAVAEERARLARELHDVVSHAISVTVLQARGARRTLGNDEDAVREALDAIEHTNTQALGDMRRLLAVLRDTEHDQGTEAAGYAPQPSLARLDDLLDRVRGSGLAVELEVSGAATVPAGVDLSAYRVIQEALTNVLKHAGGARTTVQVTYGTDALDLRIHDDGPGGAVSGSGYGLVGIRERVAVVGGTVEAGPGVDGGFQIAARLPYSLEVS